MYSPEEIANDWFNKARLDQDLYVRWKSNNNIPFDDMLLEFLNADYITVEQYVASSSQRQVEVSASIAAYRKHMETYVPDDEEMFEMRAAFGAGASVVNCITGKRIQL